MRRWDRFIVAMFVCAISIPGVATLFGVDGAPADENRELAPPPVVDARWESLRALPDAFTKYFEDHFAFRAPLVHAQADIRLRALGVSPSTAVITGKDGWLFYADDGAVEDYAVAPEMSQSDLETWSWTLQDVQDWLAGQGIAYAFVVAPDKHVIYPEMMPASVHRLREQSRIDQFVAYLRAHSTVNVVDLRPALLEAKQRERIYHRTDTHWNDRGALVAYQQIIASLHVDGLTPLPRAAFVDAEIQTPGLDLAGMLGLKDRLPEQDLRLVPRTPRRARIVEPVNPQPHGIYDRLATAQADTRLPRAVIYRDSFMSALIPFLSEHFSRALYLWEPDVNPHVIADERPNVVIQEWVGRRLGPKLPYNFVADQGLRSNAAARPAQSAAGAASRSPSPAPAD